MLNKEEQDWFNNWKCKGLKELRKPKATKKQREDWDLILKGEYKKND